MYNSYSIASVYGNEYIGGFIPYLDISSSEIGGLVGESYNSTVSNCYSAGSVNGDKYVGGLVGVNSASTMNNCFWDKQTSGFDTSAGGTGKTTAEMKTKSTFTSAGWNYKSIWAIDDTVNNGYPYINDRGITFAGIEPIDTDGDGYRNISCYSHLQWVSNNSSSWDWNLELDNNINADTTWLLTGGLGFSPIGSDTTAFTGKFEGNGFAIDSLYINRFDTFYSGLFGKTKKALVSNLGIINCNVIGRERVGGLVGFVHDYSTVINCYSTGMINGKCDVGGLIGFIAFSEVNNSHSDCNVSGEYEIGGLVGYTYSSSASSSYSNGEISMANYEAGGLVGGANSSTISNCYSTSIVSADSTCGGLVGKNYLSTVSNSYSIGNVSGSKYVGGLVGKNYSSTVFYSFWDKQTSGLDSSDGGIGKTSSEMKTKLTFASAGWDFDTTWAIAADYNDGYPNLDGKNDPNSIIEYHALNRLVYPQPASDELFVRLSETSEEAASIKLYDQNGRLALAIESTVNNGLIRLNTSDLSVGVYQMIISIDGKTYTEKVVIAK